jgi:hydrogenase maturation protease
MAVQTENKKSGEDCLTQEGGMIVVSARRPLVMGVGNVLMGDEGVGVHAARLLEEQQLPGMPTVLDGGTGGFHLLSLFEEYDPIILIDATMDGRPAGTVRSLQPKFASDFPRTLSAHDIGLRDLLETAGLLGTLPTMYLITISIDRIQSMCMDLSAPVAASLGQVRETVKDLLRVVEVKKAMGSDRGELEK